MIYSLPFSLKSLDWLQKIQKWQDKQKLLSIELTVGKGELPKNRERERERDNEAIPITGKASAFDVIEVRI